VDRVSSPAGRTNPELSATKITLYELIDVISEEVQPGDDQLVAEVVLHLFETGQAKSLSPDIKDKRN
jgi:hypothetical protein